VARKLELNINTKQMREWTEKDVCYWITSFLQKQSKNIPENLSSIIEDNSIDGKVLIIMNQNELERIFKFSFGVIKLLQIEISEKNTSQISPNPTPISILAPVSFPKPVSNESTPFQYRQHLSPNEPILPLGSIEIKDFKPKFNCLGEVQLLQKLADMDKLNIILQECIEFSEAAKWGNNPYSLDDNEIFAIALYTHDLFGQADREKNFYFQLNNMLRKRSPEIYEKWRGYLYYLQSALSKFPNIETTVYRGIPAENFELIKKEYKEKRPIFWSAFSSSTPDLKVAQGFAKQNGIIIKIKIYSGKIIKDYSIIKGEDEILLKPNSKFVVTKGIYQHTDGYSYLELEEQQKFFIF